MSPCTYCGGPLRGDGYAGRFRPESRPDAYCCTGCLNLGERTLTPATKLSGIGVQLGIGVLVTGQSMIFSLALNLHDDVPADVRWYAQTLIMAATFLVVALLGGPLLFTAWRELRRGKLTIEALFLLTLTGALAASLQALLTGRGKIYFEVVSVLLVVYTLGKVIGSRSRANALASSRAWAGQLSTCRKVDEKGRTSLVSVTEVVPGDLIEVSPGETVAVDGVVRAGVGFVHAAPVTGEPFAVVRRPGDPILAGAASTDATFRVEATVAGTKRQVDRLFAAVEEARTRPTSFQGQADRLGRIFLPAIVATALGAFVYWTFLTPRGWEEGLFNAMAVLLVACPCALGLATPVVIWSALGRLAERGVIVRTGNAVEHLAEIDRVMLDKTGTLTDDRFTILDIATVATGKERAKLLGWLSLVQERSRHPIAKPFALLPRPFAAGAEPRIRDIRVVPGCGVEAEVVEADGMSHQVQVGTHEWLAHANDSDDLSRELHITGHRVDVAVDGKIAAVAILAERLRNSAMDALEGFRALGLHVEVLTGDTIERARALNLPARGSLLPDDKRALVERAKSEGGRPLFVGDGINDASALAAAHAGIALSSGADIAVGAASITLYHGHLCVLPWAVALSREAVRTVRRNLLRALLYNVAGMTLAACGVLHPVVAAVLMVASSIMLLVSASRVGTRTAHCWNSERGTRNVERVENVERGMRNAERKTPRALTGAAIGHGAAFALQGIALLLLLDGWRESTAAGLVLGVSAVGGVALAWLWYRWSAIPHAIDMCVGMLTFGNLGMLLGWWADRGFAPLVEGTCPHCVAMLQHGIVGQPWMWLGMVAGADVAMTWFLRCTSPSRRHTLAMYTGGNLGMLAGMLAGASAAAELPSASLSSALLFSVSVMTVGMVAGMLLGTWMSEVRGTYTALG